MESLQCAICGTTRAEAAARCPRCGADPETAPEIAVRAAALRTEEKSAEESGVRRGFWINLYIVVVILGNACLAYLCLFDRSFGSQLTATYQKAIPEWYLAACGFSALAVIVALFGLWELRRWAAWALIGLAVVNLAVTVVVLGDRPMAFLVGLPGIMLFAVVLAVVWRRLR